MDISAGEREYILNMVSERITQLCGIKLKYQRNDEGTLTKLDILVNKNDEEVSYLDAIHGLECVVQVAGEMAMRIAATLGKIDTERVKIVGGKYARMTSSLASASRDVKADMSPIILQ